MKKICYIVTLLFLIGCLNSCQKRLESSSTLTEIFNESEIQDFSKILEFFDNEVCESEKVDSNNIYDCYKIFFKRMSQAVETGNIEIKIDFDSQKKLYNKISDSTFNQIWWFGKSWSEKKVDTLKYIDIRYDGKYVVFLNKLGRDYQVIEDYHKRFEAFGAITPSMINEIFVNYDQYDIKDERVRLMIAVHYLTIYDQYLRKEKY